MSQLKLSFLGPVQFSRDDTVIELKSVKGMALLAYLTVTGASQSRDHLTDLFWPDSLPDAARKNLRNTLWAIRKALGDGALEGDTDRIALNKNIWLDVRVFEETVAALQAGQAEKPDSLINLYRGQLLAGLWLADAPDFELWLTAERERLGQLYLRGLETLVALEKQKGNWQGVIATARRALTADNLQEPMHQAMMQAHAHLGERAEALRQYDALKTILAQELGVDPLPETRQLKQAILAGTLEQSPPLSPAAPLQPPRPLTKQARPTPFVGRQAEKAALDQALAAATAGTTQIILITGELGIGKSRLWQEWSTQLDASLTVLETRCLDTTQALPFAPLTGLFRQSTCARQIMGQNSQISPVWLAELARLLPEIKQNHPQLPTPPVLPPEEEHRRLFEAFTQILLTINGQPLILFIDDLHWMDQTTLDWLVYLVDRLQQYPLLLVGTYRPDDASAQLSRVSAGWGRQGFLHRLPLARLTLTETIQLLDALGRHVDRAEQLQARSAGNPYFLVELSRADVDDTPPGLTELIRTRLNRLPDTARQVLQAAAVLDSGFDFATLRRTSGRGEEETLNALDDLLEIGVLTERNGGYEFSHPLVAMVVRNDLSLARRSFLHRRAAETLEAMSASQPDLIAGPLATHYAQAGQPVRAARYAELAAQRSYKLTAFNEAAVLYREAIKLEDTPARRLGLGQALNGLGELENARQELELAGAAFERAGNLAEASQTYLEIGFGYIASGQGSKVLEWANKAVTTLGSHPTNPVLHARLHHLLAAGGLLAGRPLAEAEAHLLEAIQVAQDNNLPALAAGARFELGNLLAQRGDLPAAIESFEAALAQSGDNLFQRILAHNNLAYHLMLAGEFKRAQQNIEAALSLAGEQSLFGGQQYFFSTRGEIALAWGELDEAEQWFEKALVEANRNDNRLHAANVKANFGLTARERGNLDEALLLLEEARSEIGNLTAPFLKTKIDLWLAELYVQRGERAAARQALTRAQNRLTGSEMAGLQAWANRVQRGLQN